MPGKYDEAAKKLADLLHVKVESYKGNDGKQHFSITGAANGEAIEAALDAAHHQNHPEATLRPELRSRDMIPENVRRVYDADKLVELLPALEKRLGKTNELAVADASVKLDQALGLSDSKLFETPRTGGTSKAGEPLITFERVSPATDVEKVAMKIERAILDYDKKHGTKLDHKVTIIYEPSGKTLSFKVSEMTPEVVEALDKAITEAGQVQQTVGRKQDGLTGNEGPKTVVGTKQDGLTGKEAPKPVVVGNKQDGINGNEQPKPVIGTKQEGLAVKKQDTSKDVGDLKAPIVEQPKQTTGPMTPEKREQLRGPSQPMTPETRVSTSAPKQRPLIMTAPAQPPTPPVAQPPKIDPALEQPKPSGPMTPEAREAQRGPSTPSTPESRQTSGTPTARSLASTGMTSTEADIVAMLKGKGLTYDKPSATLPAVAASAGAPSTTGIGADRGKDQGEGKGGR
jgi:hypothetical protein